jgi:PAS domain S-box-containing protein
MRRDWLPQFRIGAAQFFFGGVGLIFLTFVCFRLGFNVATTGYAYLILIALLSLMGSIIASVILSILAVACLNYFFVPPLFEFRVDAQEDVLALSAFLATSIIVCILAIRARKAAKEARVSQKAFVETIPGLVWSALPDGSRDFHSQRWLELMGLSAKDAAGDGWTAVFHHQDRTEVVEKWRNAVAIGEPFEIEARERSANGEYRSMLVRAAPFRDAKGNIVRWYGSSIDIEDLKRATDELQRTREELARVARLTTLGELTAAIAHEVNQPLTGLVSSGNAGLRWLADDPPNLEAARRAVERMIRDGTRAAEVISRIRALVKKSPVRKDSLNVNDVVAEVLSLVQAESQRNRVTLRTNLTADLPLVLGDRIQLQQVILNLVVNANEAFRAVIDGPRELVISSIRGASNDVLVTVSDTGPGFDGAKLEKIFDPFYTTKPEGMGIGLAVSRSIVEAHGGKLWATANEPRGALFQLTLPGPHGEPR